MSPSNAPNVLVYGQLLYLCDTYSTKLTMLESPNAFPRGKRKVRGGARCVDIFISMVGAGSKKGQGRHCHYD